MRLRNKKTGEVWDIPKMRHLTMQEDDISFFVYDKDGGHLFSYKSLAELNEEWEDYKPAEKKPKRYQLVKDLPTFKAGEIFELWDSIEWQGIYRESDGVMAYHKKTLDKFPNILGEWFEEIKPAEPLIKDEKIRKAVRVWADACGAKQIKYSIAPNQYYDADMGTGFSIKFMTKPVEVYLEEGKNYTIAELCGEEEE